MSCATYHVRITEPRDTSQACKPSKSAISMDEWESGITHIQLLFIFEQKRIIVRIRKQSTIVVVFRR
jgi:hypothetical protein